MTELLDRAYSVDYLGAPQLVLDDRDLLDWAVERGSSPLNAQIEALEKGIIPLRYLKNFWALNFEEQLRLCRSRVMICGCGGLGGVLINLLARAGVGTLRLIDGDVFVPTNLNRQLLCVPRQISRSKAEVAAEYVRTVNPLIEVEPVSELLDETNVEQLIQEMHLTLDALDNLPGRFLLAEGARRQRIPFVHAAVAGWWGQIGTFLPDAPFDLNDVYGTRRAQDPTEDSIGVLGPLASIIGSLEALEALRILSGRTPAYAGQLLYFDGESGRTERIPFTPS